MERIVKSCGGTGHVYLPRGYIGCKVKIEVIEGSPRDPLKAGRKKGFRFPKDANGKAVIPDKNANKKDSDKINVTEQGSEKVAPAEQKLEEKPEVVQNEPKVEETQPEVVQEHQKVELTEAEKRLFAETNGE